MIAEMMIKSDKRLGFIEGFLTCFNHIECSSPSQRKESAEWKDNALANYHCKGRQNQCQMKCYDDACQ